MHQTTPAQSPTIDDYLEGAESAFDDAERARRYLLALERSHELGDPKGIEQAMRRMSTPTTGGAILADQLDGQTRYRFDALRLDLAIVAGENGRIQPLLAELHPQGEEQAKHAMALRARALAAIGDIARATRLLIALADVTAKPAALEVINGTIWRHLSRMPVYELRARAKSASTASELAWWKLAADFNAAVTNRGQALVWHRWLRHNPDHPAARHPPPRLRRAARDPGHLALLVPVGGDFGPAGQAVRDGFLAAYLHAGAPAQRIQVYDTSSMSIPVAYDAAVRQGAEVIVGPLQREAVAALRALSPGLPVIALNHLEPGVDGVDTMVQFSLAIEDQASAIADALTTGGIQRVVLFDSPARWSVRARARLEDELDGVEAVGYGTFHRIAEVTEIVGDALHIDDSQTRAREIESLLGTSFEFAPRRRDDLDAVVALIDAAELLSLKPALDFHFAGDLPVFATATATLAGANLSRLEGLRVCAMPWTLDAGALGAVVNDAFPASRGTYASLFALGVDGFRLANQFDRLTELLEPIPGSTGVLSLGDDGRIRRDLVWAVVSGGRLLPLLDDAD